MCGAHIWPYLTIRKSSYNFLSEKTKQSTLNFNVSILKKFGFKAMEQKMSYIRFNYLLALTLALYIRATEKKFFFAQTNAYLFMSRPSYNKRKLQIFWRPEFYLSFRQIYKSMANRVFLGYRGVEIFGHRHFWEPFQRFTTVISGYLLESFFVLWCTVCLPVSLRLILLSTHNVYPPQLDHKIALFVL